MAVRTQKKNPSTTARRLPIGVKPWTGPIDPKLAKMIKGYPGIASGGRNIVHRKKG